jgi:hypothetical protein
MLQPHHSQDAGQATRPVRVPMYLDRADMTALAMLLRSALTAGAFAKLGPDLGDTGYELDPERVARITLADIEHLNEWTESRTNRDKLAARRWDLARDVLRLLRLAEEHLGFKVTAQR